MWRQVVAKDVGEGFGNVVEVVFTDDELASKIQ